MVFSSTIFIFLFLPIAILGYYIIHPKLRNAFLLIISLFFYAWGEPKFVFIMISSIFVNYIFGLLVDRYRDQKTVAKSILASMCIFNIGVFYIFKYLNFTISNLNLIFNDSITQTNILLPIGISFFTFQAMSYVIDVYRQQGEVQKNPFYVGLYITFFPQLIAGPIVRYETVAYQINNRNENIDDFAEGIKRFIVGLSKKVLLSNTLAAIADKAYSYNDFSELSVAMAWIGAAAYSLQILYDFSGYSDMAIGMGKMFGFHFNENFNYPYISKSISEFWRRWHISLGTWFRDYVYFPLGGSRVTNKGRLVFNLFIVWLLTGVWHGASWTFVIWGQFYFILLAFEKLSGYPKKFKTIIAKQLYRVFTLLCIILGWVVFRAEDLKTAFGYMGSMFGLQGNDLYDNIAINIFTDNLLILILGIIFTIPIGKWIKEKINENNKFVVVSSILIKGVYLILFIICAIFTVSSTYNPFIYFNF